MIQYMKAIFFEDTVSATSILNCETALECKRASSYIKGYNNKTWSKCAQEMCEGGIFQKFKQNLELAAYLLQTSGKKLTEASRDRTWGNGMQLNDDRALVECTWYSQGLLGKILEGVRDELVNTSGSNESESTTLNGAAGMEISSEERPDVQHQS